MEEVATMPSNAQEFCLRWNNFHSSLVSALDGFKNDLDFVDVTLACEGQFLKAHKMLLSACSVFFRDLLKANPCQHPIVILPPEVRFIDLEKMLRFIYQGEVNVHQENLARFLKTAEMLKIRGLAEDNEKKVFQASSPRPQDGGGSERGNDNSSVSPKRPRLSIEAQSGSITDPSQTSTDENSRLSGPDSDSEMIPVKQEMIELKECDFESADNESFLPETYLREGSSATSSNNTSNTQPPQAHPAAPPPPGPLLPSYVPPPQVKSQDDSPLASNQEELSQEFDDRGSLYLGSDPIGGGVSIDRQLIDGSFPSHSVPWRRSMFGEDGYVLCPQCKKPITSYNLNRHIKMVHSCMERAQCQICNKQFKNKYSLGTHMHRQHHGDHDQLKQPNESEQHGLMLNSLSQVRERNGSYHNNETFSRHHDDNYRQNLDTSRENDRHSSNRRVDREANLMLQKSLP